MNSTRSRGYLWFSILIVLLLVGLLVWGSLRGRCAQALPTDTIISSDTLSSITPQSSHSSSSRRHHSVRRSTDVRRQVSSDQNVVAQSYSRPIFVERKPFVFELNSADTNDLQELYGIGSYFSRAIVRYREQLGGFHSKEQLLEVPGMTPDRYHKALRNAVCNIDQTLCRQLNVNTATLRQLKSHPYLDYWQAKAIVQLRDKGVRYHCPDDLLQVSLMDTVTLQRLIPYLSFE